MAPTEVIVLSSSPTTSFIATTPPRPHLLLKNQSLLISETRATALPEGAFPGFATASSLLRQTYAVVQNEEIAEEEHGKANPSTKKPPVTKKPLKRNLSDENPSKQKTAKVKKARGSKEAADKVPKKPRALRKKPPQQETKPAETVEYDQGQPVTKAQPARKPRARKSADETQAKTKKARATKTMSNDTPAKANQTTEDFQSLQTPNIDRRLQAGGLRDDLAQENPTEPELDETKENELEKPRGLGLSKVLARRRDWTPAKDVLLEELIVQNLLTFPHSKVGIDLPQFRATEAGFGTLLSDYNYVHSADDTVNGSVLNRNWDGEAVTKRRKLDVGTDLTCAIYTILTCI